MIWNIVAVIVCSPIGIFIYKTGNKKLGLFNIGIGSLNLLAIIYQLIV